MRVDQKQISISQLSFAKAAGSSSTDSFSAALRLDNRASSPLIEDGTENDQEQGAIVASDEADSADPIVSLLEELSKWAHMSPAEKIRAQWLGSHGLTEESFSQLPSDEQAAINKQIADEIKRQIAGESDNKQVAFG
jgi:hypothetical protein